MWLKRLTRGLFGGPKPKNDASGKAAALRDVGEAIIASVECDRCSERIDVRLRKSSDIPSGSEGDPFEFFVQKTIVGNRCFNRIELRLEMDARYRLIRYEAKGGRLITEESDSK